MSRMVATWGPPGALRGLWPRARGHHRGPLPDLPRAVRHRGDLCLVRVVRADDRGRLGRRRLRLLADVRLTSPTPSGWHAGRATIPRDAVLSQPGDLQGR